MFCIIYRMIKKLSILVIVILLTACGKGLENLVQTPSPETAAELPKSQAVTSADTALSEATSDTYISSDTLGDDCRELTASADEIPTLNYILKLRNKYQDVEETLTYSYVDPSGPIARNGPFAAWYYEMAIEDIMTVKPKKFSTFKVLQMFGVTFEWQDYLDYVQSACDAYTGAGSKRSLQVGLEKFLEGGRHEWTGHASHWEAFEYIETGPNVIESPSPPGLEHYTKYISGGGVIIVGGATVPDEALLTARESVVYMTSARPEFREILKRNEVRISLFGPQGDVSVLPEYPDENEPGGFAMGMTDVSMTANAGWLCYPGNWDIGGDPVIHEMVHTINHVVFEEINEAYFYERIYELALDAIDRDIFVVGEQHIQDGSSQDISHIVGEYWAISVEGYIMDRPGFKRSHDTRDWIRENDPNLYELITRYFPTEDWEFCPGVEDQDLFGPDHPYSQP